MQLASKFSRKSHVLRSTSPIDDDALRAVAPSIFADDKHASRSDSYAYIPTIDVLSALRQEGFLPFFVCQTKSRDDGKRDHAKHMIRMRHAGQINSSEANEIILLNSHDGSSSYQMLAGVFRFVCNNGMVCGDTVDDIRIRHKGNIIDNVIEGAFRVLEDFEGVNEQKEGMKALTLDTGEQHAFAHAALLLKYDAELAPPPITESQLLRPRRTGDVKDDLWTTFNRVQESMIKGGLRGRAANGKTVATRAVSGIDQNVKLNRALWTLAESMRKLKA